MPVSRTGRKAKERAIRIDVGGGEDLNILFNSRRMTPGWLARMTERESAGDVLAFSRGMVEVIISWDMVEEDGSPTPLTVEYLADSFDLEEMGELMKKLVEAATPSSEEGNVSSDTSAMDSTDSVSSPEIPQNGPQPSLSPKPSESPQLR